VAGRGRKTAVVLTVLVVLLGGLLVVADRVAASAAESVISGQVAKEMAARNVASAGPPEVSVRGFPFLTQVLRGRYDGITIAVPQPRVGGVQLQRLTLDATDVTAPLEVITSHQGRVIADKITGTAELSWQSVSTLLDMAGATGVDPSSVQLSYVNGEVQLTAPATLAGRQLTLVATGTVAFSSGKIRLQLTRIVVKGDGIPASVSGLAQAYVQYLSGEIKLPVLPYQPEISDVRTTSAGITVTALARQVVLAG